MAAPSDPPRGGQSDFEYDPGYPPDVECCVCLAPWHQPVELVPCGHILCAACVAQVASCPECRSSIDDRRQPNRVLRNIVLSLPGRCARCGWRGVRGQHQDSHTAASCDRLLSTQDTPFNDPVSQRTSPPPDDGAAEAGQVATAAITRQRSSDVFSCPDSAATFLAFFQNGASNRTPPRDTSLAGGARLRTPLLGAQYEATGDAASSPYFSEEVTLAVAVIRGEDGCAPPLDFHTVSAPLATTTVDMVAHELCPDVFRPCRPDSLNLPGPSDEAGDGAEGAAHAAYIAIVGDDVVADTRAPLNRSGVQHGAFLYLLTNGAQDSVTAVELFKLRSQLDSVTRELRVAEASPAGSPESNGRASWRRCGDVLPRLLRRLDALDRLSPPLRQLKRRTCVDAAAAEEILDRLQASRTPQPPTSRPPNTSFAAVPGPADQAAVMSEEPWLLYNLSQRFYDALLAAFAAFDDDGRGVLNRAQTTRVCRWMNLPSDGDTMNELFTTFCGPSTQAQLPRGEQASASRVITFHQLCLWVQRHMRRPLHDYGLPFARYYEAIDIFHSLDGDRSGALRAEEAEQFLQRFAGMDGAVAKSLVDRLLARLRVMVVERHADGAAAPAAASLAAAPSSTDLRRWAAERDEEIPVDILLRVLCTEEQGWEFCEAVADDATGTEAPAPTSASVSPRTVDRSTRLRALTAALTREAGPSRPPPSSEAGAVEARHHRLRSLSTGNGRRQGREGKDKDCVVA